MKRLMQKAAPAKKTCILQIHQSALLFRPHMKLKTMIDNYGNPDECLDLSPMYFNTTVVITEWNYIAASSVNAGDCYIEINGLMPLKNARTPPEMFPTCTVDNANFFQYNRDLLNKDLINIVGHVKAMSELIRLKDCVIFLIRLENFTANSTKCVVSILVKDFKLLHWQTVIRPNRVYMFTDMKLTTLNPGDKNECKIFICSDQSQLIHVEEADFNKLHIIDLKNFLEIKGVTNFEDLFSKWRQSSGSSSRSPACPNLRCVQGTVSNNLRAKEGIFELDKNMRLYVTHTASHQLRIGTQVCVYNTHFYRASQTPKLRLFCCSYSCVKISAFSDVTSSSTLGFEQVVLSSSRPTILRLVHDYGLSLGDLECLIYAQTMLEYKLLPRIVSNPDVVLLKIVTSPSCINQTALIRKRERNMIVEFFDAEHNACQKKKKSFHVPTVEEVKSYQITTSESSPCVPNSSLTRDVSSYWRPTVISSDEFELPWVLVGLLKGNRHTGRLQLVDQSGAIDCVTASWHCNERMTSHVCAKSKCQSAESRCTCVQTQWLGRLCRIDRFQLVIEAFTGPETIFRRYLQFSVLDVLPLCEPSHQVSVSKNKPLTEQSAEELMKPRDTSCELPKSGGEECSHNVSRQESIVPLIEVLSEKSCTCSVYQIFVMEYGESVVFKSKIPNQISLCCSVVGCFVGPSRFNPCGCLPSTNQSYQRCASTYPHLVQVAINLEHDSLKWYPVLYSGCVYRLTKRRCCNPRALDGTPGFPSGVKTDSRKVHARMSLHLNDNIEFERLDLETLCELDNLSTDEEDALKTLVSEVCNKNNTTSDVGLCFEDLSMDAHPGTVSTRDLVSITGVIVARSFANLYGTSSPSWKLDPILETFGMSVPWELPVLVTINDLSSKADIDVYMNLEQIQYPLGLLVGALVRFDRVERKLSQKNRQYCKFFIISSCSLLALAPSRAQQDVSSRNVNGVSACAKIYLADLWNISLRSQAVYLVTGHVHLVFRVGLKMDRTVSPEVFSADASFLLDDGTTSSFVRCTGDQVADLLQLEASQWKALQEMVMPLGEVHYCIQTRSGKVRIGAASNHTDRAALVEWFLYELCDSSLVKRSVTVRANRFRTLLSATGEKIADLSTLQLSDCERKLVRKGSRTVDTTSLPALQLDCIEFIKR